MRSTFSAPLFSINSEEHSSFLTFLEIDHVPVITPFNISAARSLLHDGHLNLVSFLPLRVERGVSLRSRDAFRRPSAHCF